MKLVVINSIGPMGSSVVASIIEKYGFINLPIRKTKLSNAVINKTDFNHDEYKKLFLKQALHLENKGKIGGVSVFKRDLLKSKKRLKINRGDLKIYKKKKFKSLSDLYFYSMNLANRSTVYKKKISKVNGSIELAIDSFKFDNKLLEKNYKKKFKKVYFINCTRNFETWIETLCLVRFVKKPISFQYLKFNIYKWKKVYDNYNQNFKLSNGININFEEIFLPNTHKTIKKIEKYLGVKSKKRRNFQKEYFDLFGHIENFNTAFTQFDKKKHILNKLSISILKLYYNLRPNFVFDILFSLIFNFFYLYDFCRFKFRKETN